MKKAKCEAAHSATRPKVSGKTVFFLRNDRLYGLKRFAFQTKNALKVFLSLTVCGGESFCSSRYLCFAPQKIDGALRTAQHKAGMTHEVVAVLICHIPYFSGIKTQRVF